MTEEDKAEIRAMIQSGVAFTPHVPHYAVDQYQMERIVEEYLIRNVVIESYVSNSVLSTNIRVNGRYGAGFNTSLMNPNLPLKSEEITALKEKIRILEESVAFLGAAE